MFGCKRYIRIGHGVKGMLYGLIGLFLINDIMYGQPVVSGSDGVLVALGRRPMGSIMLTLTGPGAAGYVLWRLIQAGVDPEHQGRPGWRIGAALWLCLQCFGLPQVLPARR